MEQLLVFMHLVKISLDSQEVLILHALIVELLS